MSTPTEDWQEMVRTHEHAFLTSPGRCMWCGIHSEELRRQQEHEMLVTAFTRLADVLDRLETTLDRIAPPR